MIDMKREGAFGENEKAAGSIHPQKAQNREALVKIPVRLSVSSGLNCLFRDAHECR